jgi:hypothetical protein
MRCEACHGLGILVSSQHPCAECGGTGIGHCCDGLTACNDPIDERHEIPHDLTVTQG